MVRFDIVQVDLDPAIGSEIKKSRPALIVSPMTGAGFSAPTRIPCQFRGKAGFILLDQLRAVDRTRVRRSLGKIDSATGALRMTLVPRGLIQVKAGSYRYKA